MKKANGFSLPEMLITLAVAGIVLALATPSYTSLVRDNRLTSHANLFVTAMNTARERAQKNGSPVTVSPLNNDWANGFAVENAPDDPFRREFPADATGITFKSAAGAESFTFFPPYGSIDLVAGDVLTLTDEHGEGRIITVSGTGNVSVKRIE